MNIVLLGMPGAGKGTQARVLSETYGFPHISPGVFLRRSVVQETELGGKVGDALRVGYLIQDSIVEEIIFERLRQNDCQEGFILDGFPRTIEQARALNMFLGEGNGIEKAVYLKINEEEALSRLVGRIVCSTCDKEYHVLFYPPRREHVCDDCGGRLYRRDDDREKAIKERVQVFWTRTVWLLNYYKDREILFTINGEESIDEVNRSIRDILE